MSQPKWKKASYSSIQVKDTSLSAKTGTIKKLRSTDIDVSTIHGSNSIGVSTNINDTSYNTSKYSALTISAEAIQYQGGGKPENIMVGGKHYEQYIQPLIFENKAGISTIKARGVLAHLSEIEKDSDTSLSAFGLFSAPNENLILTVAQDNGVFDYIDGSNSNSLSYTKTGIFIDKSNRIFMGISGEDLTSDKLDYLVKGNKQAQLYVNGDIVVDGSGVQIDKYIVDDILVGESVAIMGNHLELSGMVNDISAAVPNLENTLGTKENDTQKQGYLMVANNTYLYSDLIFPTSDVSNSTDKITGSIQFHDPSGETICSISAFNDDKLLDISGSDNINMHSTDNINMHSTENIDISSGTIQMYGSDISMQSTDNINMQAAKNIDISSENIQLNVSFTPQTDGDGFVSETPISNSITYSYSTTDASSMALAIFDVGVGKTPEDYSNILDHEDASMAIPTVHYVKNYSFWKEYDRETATLNNDVNPDISNIYVPNNIKCNTLSLPEHFETVCIEVTEFVYPWYFYGFFGEIFTYGDCVTVAEPNTTTNNAQITDFSSNIFVHGVASMLYTTPSGETSLTKGGLAVFPQDEGSAGMSVISHRKQASDAATATIFFGDALGSNSSSMIDTNIGAIRGEIDGSESNRNMRFYGSDASSKLVNFMSYLGGDTSNMLDISAGNVSITLDTDGVITKSTYTTETDHSNSLVDLSFVLNHVSENATYWEPVPDTSNAIQPKDISGNNIQVRATTFHATSDAVKKENIRTISGALESIDQLRGVTYNLKADETQKTHHGVIAQEIEQIFPDMVAGIEGNKSVAYMEIIGVLIEAVKDLKTRVEELENK